MNARRAATLILLAFAAPMATANAQQTERFTLPADRAAVYDLVGQIQVQAGSGTEVVIEIVRGGRDAAQLTVERGPVGSYDALRVIFPEDDIVYPLLSRGSNSNFHVRDDGTFGDDQYGRRRGRGFGRQVNVRGSGPGLEAFADLNISVPAGAELAVYLGVGKAMLSNVNGRIHVDAASSSVTAQGMRGSLDVDVGSGSVSITDADGDLSIDTGSGDVMLTGVRGRDLTIDTGSGDIRGSDVTIEKASVETGSGDLTLSAVRGADLHFETGSGNIEVELATDIRAVSVETGSGDVLLRVPESLGAMVDFDTGSGRIETDLPLQVQRWGKDHVTGRLGDGQGQLDVETGSGDVRILRMATTNQ
ncbi:MAG: DUF4097 family beta strand repeat protein [Gemmatimonadetes bacterium]|nr:DUF4097 family beta strand repeat protein [Gemmatimonadota bacterium]